MNPSLRKTRNLLALMAATVVFSGCSKDQSQYGTPPAETNEVKKEIQDAANRLQYQLSQTGDQVVAAMEKQLQILDARIGELAIQSRNHAGNARTEAEAALTALRERTEKAQRDLDELRGASRETWQIVWTHFGHAKNDLETTYEELKVRFSN